MQIILLEKVGGLGNLGDLVNVKNGYARNFLIPQGKAQRANAANLAAFEEKRAEYEAHQAAVLADAEARKLKLDGQNISVAQKAGVDGRLFGSVTTHDIAEAIKAANGPLKAIGEYEIEVALHSDAVAAITVTVVAAAE